MGLQPQPDVGHGRQRIVTHAMLDLKTISALQRKLNPLIEHEALVHQIPKSTPSPATLFVSQGAFHGVHPRLPVGKSVGQENVQIGIGVGLTVADIEKEVVSAKGVLNVPLKPSAFVAFPAQKVDVPCLRQQRRLRASKKGHSAHCRRQPKLHDWEGLLPPFEP